MKKPREIVGIFFRIEREGKWQSLDIADLTEEELRELLDGWTKDTLTNLVWTLCDWIYSFVKEDVNE